MSRRSIAWALTVLLAGCCRGQETSRPAPPPAAAAPPTAAREPAPATTPVTAAHPAAATAGKREDAAAASTPAWRFDASDQQMQQVIQYSLDTTGCRLDQPECPGLAEALRDGGDRLASYLVDQYQRAGPDHPAAQALLDLAAATRSPAAFAYLADQLTHPGPAGPAAARQAANALWYAPEVTTMSIVLDTWGAAPDDDALHMALVDAWERAALTVPGRRQDGIQALRMMSTNPTFSPELRGYVMAAQMCLEFGTDCPTR